MFVPLDAVVPVSRSGDSSGAPFTTLLQGGFTPRLKGIECPLNGGLSMKSDYCLEDLNEGATVCPHCAREQLWASRERHKQTYGCILKLFLTVVGVILAIFIIGGIMQGNDQRSRDKREAQEAAEKVCAPFVSAGDYTTTAECVSKGNLEDLALYSDHLEERCKGLYQRASSASSSCILNHSPSSKKCEKLAAIESSLMDWKACAVSQRQVDRSAGLTPSAALKLPTQRNP